MLGKITNWKELGGEDAEIILGYRDQAGAGKYSGVGYMSRRLMFNDPNINFTEEGKILTYPSSGPLEKAIVETPNMIGITGVSSAKKRDVKILKLDGLEASKENIASGEYPLFRPLYLVTRGEPDGLSKEFIDWILSEEGQEVVSQAGTVNLIEGKSLKDKFQYWEKSAVPLNYNAL
jgi:phosphate transport system substrate-binding protein